MTVGNARVPILIGLVGAILLMGVAVFVATMGDGRIRASPAPTVALDRPGSPGLSSSPSPSASLPVAACLQTPNPEPGSNEVLVYFGCDPNSAGIRPVVRDVADGADPSERMTTALDALFDGPAPEERGPGFTPALPAEWADVSFTVELLPDGLAILDFDQSILDLGPPNTAAQFHFLTESIGSTGFQFLEVTAMELRVRGSCGAFVVWMGELAGCLHLAEPLGAVGDCPIVEPASLPSGAPLTPPRAYRNLGGGLSWGSGDDTVTLWVSHRSSIGIEQFADAEGAVPMQVGENPGWAFSDGRELEPGVVRPMIAWEDGQGCVYTAYFAGGSSLADLERGAARFAGEAPEDATAHGWWSFQSGDLNGEPIAGGRGLFIDSHSLSGRTPCNAYMAEVTFEGPIMSITQFQVQELECMGDTWASEEAYLAALSVVTTGQAYEDRLVLSGPGVELRIDR